MDTLDCWICSMMILFIIIVHDFLEVKDELTEEKLFCVLKNGLLILYLLLMSLAISLTNIYN